ncbi:MAG: sugar phosphate isomerase/epimerase [Spirochaetes bacterium]|nr:sugar phosphate isomerase/epimerase [Spirochaetota bacterium]
MGRLVTLFTGQWADLPFETMCQKAKDFGYEGLELACWGDHMDVFKAAVDKKYCEDKLATLKKYGLKLYAISNHLAGQLICDPNFDARSDGFAPADCKGNAEKKRAWAIESMKNAARAAKNLGIGVVCGFTGSPVWHMIYSFPPVTQQELDEGYAFFAKTFNPILDVFKECGVKFALEVHPTEIAFDIYSTKRALEAIKNRPEFGFNFDPSHLLWQGLDPKRFIETFGDRIYHVHMKDAIVTLNGYEGILGSHLEFGDPRRGWNFRSLGHGTVNFEEIIRALNNIGYKGPLSVEWEDSGMDREHGAKEAAMFVKKVDFAPSQLAFDAAFSKK